MAYQAFTTENTRREEAAFTRGKIEGLRYAINVLTEERSTANKHCIKPFYDVMQRLSVWQTELEEQLCKD